MKFQMKQVNKFGRYGMGKNWKWLVGLFLFALVCTGAIGLFGRFTLDGAITNRPQIWLSGLKLYAANIGGVGAGGQIVIIVFAVGIDKEIVREQIHLKNCFLVRHRLRIDLFCFDNIIIVFGKIRGFENFRIDRLFYAFFQFCLVSSDLSGQDLNDLVNAVFEIVRC